MSKPRIIITVGRPRPFTVKAPGIRARSFASFERAVSFALSVAPAPAPDPAPARTPIIPDPGCVDIPESVYRVKAIVSGLNGFPVTVQLDVKGRGREQALANFDQIQAVRGRTVDRIIRVRHLSRRDPNAKAAKQKRGKADRSARIRRQRNSRETRVLKDAGLSDSMADRALAEAARPDLARVARA